MGFKGTPEARLGEWGPFTVQRTASGGKIGYVITVFDNSGERVEIRTTPKGRGMTVRHVLWSDASSDGYAKITREEE